MSEDFRFFVAMLIWLVGASAMGIGFNQLLLHGLGAIIGVLFGGVIAILVYFFLPRSRE
jgi:hypothetical protein